MSKCAHYEKDTAIPVSDEDREIIVEQLKFLCTNLPPKDSALFIFNQLFCHTSGGTADKIMRELHSIIKTKHPVWSEKR